RPSRQRRNVRRGRLQGPDRTRTGEHGHAAELRINTLRDAGHRSIAAGLREVSYTPFTRPLDLLGLT
ncbi:hypothetical protein, partial [Streptomyces kaempferi]